jgi:hypothetical protein
MRWTRPIEALVEFCIAMWLLEIIFKTDKKSELVAR